MNASIGTCRRIVSQCLATSPLHQTRFTLLRASYFTNTETMKKDDPYAQLDLTWGATTTEIKDAYKQKARALHPDVNKSDTPEKALKKFQAVQLAYAKLMDVKGAPHRDDLMEEWSFAVWRNGDILAQERTDVAGVARKRPVKPAAAEKNPQWGVAALGHPDGGGNKSRRAEYLGDGTAKGPRSSTVGTGQNKWVTPKEFKPWNPKDVKQRAGSPGTFVSNLNRDATRDSKV